MITGDFWGKSSAWYKRRLSSRGVIVTEFVASKKMAVIKVGRKNTCTDRSGLIIDLTLALGATSRLAKHWKVLSDYSTSPHKYISYPIEQQMITKFKRNKR